MDEGKGGEESKMGAGEVVRAQHLYSYERETGPSMRTVPCGISRRMARWRP